MATATRRTKQVPAGTVAAAQGEPVPAAVASAFHGLHTFHLADSTATYGYTDQDVALVKDAFAARIAVDKADEKLAPALVRIFGDDWTKDGAATELKKPVREFIRAVLPEYQALLTKRHQYAAAAKVGGVSTSESRAIRLESQYIEGKITRMVEQSARLWRDHLAAQDPDFKPQQPGRQTKTAAVICDNAQEALEKRAAKGGDDSHAAKMAALIVSQLPERATLFAALMRATARVKVSDADAIKWLDSLTEVTIPA